MNETELSIIVSVGLILLTIIGIQTLIIFYLLREKLLPSDKTIKELLK